MPTNKPPDNPDEAELDENDIEIIEEPSLREDDLFTFVRPGIGKVLEEERGSQPIVLNVQPEPVRPKVIRTWEHILMREDWSFCHVKLPNAYRIDINEWQLIAKENGFSVSLMGYMFTVYKTENTKRMVLMYLFGQLLATGLDIAIRFFPQGIEFRPNKP